MKKLFAVAMAATLLFGIAGTTLAQSAGQKPIQIAQGDKMGKMSKGTKMTKGKTATKGTKMTKGKTATKGTKMTKGKMTKGKMDKGGKM